MRDLKEDSKTEKSNPIDEYFQCLSYCDIHPKGIDNDCEVICMERHLKVLITIQKYGEDMHLVWVLRE